MSQEANDPLDNFFNVPAVVEEPSVPTVTGVQSILDEDFEVARTNTREAVEIAQRALKELAGISTQMQQPRAYDALSKMIAAVTQSTKAMMELHKHKQDVTDPEANAPVEYHTHNTVIMTTAEMQQRIDDARKASAESAESDENQ